MNKTQEALKLALEALENAWLDASMGKGDVARHTEAIAAIREALAEQPAQQQEPVVRWICKGCGHEYMEAPTSCDCMESREYERIEYYTSPPANKPWMGLTDEEIDECYYWKDRQWTTDELVRYVEAKLREKNA